jgi:hypothetical protein
MGKHAQDALEELLEHVGDAGLLGGGQLRQQLGGRRRRRLRVTEDTRDSVGK